MNIRLEPVNENNYLECVQMPKVNHVASNAFSIVQAYVFEDTHPYCIFNDDVMVGFAMYKVLHEEIDIYCMNRLYVAEEHQNKGCGKAAVKMLLKMMKERHDCTEVFTSTNFENERALHVYESLGFKRTGEFDGNEVVLAYEFE